MNRIPFIGLLALMTGLRTVAAAPRADDGSAKEAVAILRADIAEKPSRVLLAVEDALTMSEQSACEIVKAAIEATHADARLTGEIVFTALKNAPAMAATTIECALRTSPGAEAQIKEAAGKALGEKEAAVTTAEPEKTAAEPVPTGKEGVGKGAAEPVPDDSGGDATFDLFRIGWGGIYLFTPDRGGIRVCDPRDPCCHGELSQACLRP